MCQFSELNTLSWFNQCINFSITTHAHDKLTIFLVNLSGLDARKKRVCSICCCRGGLFEDYGTSTPYIALFL